MSRDLGEMSGLGKVWVNPGFRFFDVSIVSKFLEGICLLFPFTVDSFFFRRLFNWSIASVIQGLIIHFHAALETALFFYATRLDQIKTFQAPLVLKSQTQPPLIRI